MASLWPGSVVDVSFVVGMLVDKFVYHQPLYRQHQRLAREHITLFAHDIEQHHASGNYRARTDLRRAASPRLAQPHPGH
jgi:hypothetical protein